MKTLFYKLFPKLKPGVQRNPEHPTQVEILRYLASGGLVYNWHSGFVYKLGSSTVVKAYYAPSDLIWLVTEETFSHNLYFKLLTEKEP